MAEIRVAGPVVEGSIVVLQGVEYDDEEDRERFVQGLVTQLTVQLGHGRFVVMELVGQDDKEVVVVGPDDLKATVERLLAAPAPPPPLPPAPERKKEPPAFCPVCVERLCDGS